MVGDDPNVKAWMAVYVGDWDADTADLSCEEDGAYFRLVRHYWRRGPPPDDNVRLARIVGVTPARWRAMRPVLAGFFKIEGGVWTHKRVARELVDAAARKKRYVERAAKGGRATAAKRKKDASSGASSGASSTKQAPLKHRSSPSPSPEWNNGPSDNVIPLPGAGADSLPGDDQRRAQAEAEASMTPEEKAHMQAELRELVATMKGKRMPE